ncbi:hypothetical protein AT1G56225 [Arabidopsis thaliana]|uniref:Uncharacterized protein n=1 Tax=Arabidopsis thaliana TaxID=3702 RepID=A0A1P8ASQ0_ARATH|nr:uncharacterized protein AT1G56225 [Arabidopsis thaliana]ANM59693.1 hypothetical protein AT1G56225 [Arabidopsis thaliana]|eukprot:NP_001322033.1 hypothetical protein AT1G56225 [Arabidopsis thaliana]
MSYKNCERVHIYIVVKESTWCVPTLLDLGFSFSFVEKFKESFSHGLLKDFDCQKAKFSVLSALLLYLDMNDELN